jgi:tetratricopeptide (TPR) repeat protein
MANAVFTSPEALAFARRTLELFAPAPVPVEAPVEPREPSKPRMVGEINYAKWDDLDVEEEKKKEEERKFAGMCSQDHRKERELYERPTSEKLEACELFKVQGNTAIQEKSYSLAALHYRKALLQLDYTFPDTKEEEATFAALTVACHLNMALAKIHLNELDEAMTHLYQVHRHDPNNVKAFLRRTHVFLLRDKLDEAAGELRKVAALGVDSPDYRRLTEELRKKQSEYQRKTKDMCKVMLS